MPVKEFSSVRVLFFGEVICTGFSRKNSLKLVELSSIKRVVSFRFLGIITKLCIFPINFFSTRRRTKETNSMN